MNQMKDESLVKSLSVDDTYVDQYGDEDDNIDPSVPTKYRGTAADKREMKVIGKPQVLRVCTVAIKELDQLLTITKAQLQVHCHAGLCINGNGQLGNTAAVRSLMLLCASTPTLMISTDYSHLF